MPVTRLAPVALNLDAALAEATIHYRRQALYRMTKALSLQKVSHKILNQIG